MEHSYSQAKSILLNRGNDLYCLSKYDFFNLLDVCLVDYTFIARITLTGSKDSVLAVRKRAEYLGYNPSFVSESHLVLASLRKMNNLTMDTFRNELNLLSGKFYETTSPDSLVRPQDFVAMQVEYKLDVLSNYRQLFATGVLVVGRPRLVDNFSVGYFFRDLKTLGCLAAKFGSSDKKFKGYDKRILDHASFFNSLFSLV